MNKKSSFTLIELLVVIVIIGILASVIIISTSSNIGKANNAKLQVELSNLSKALDNTYFLGGTTYPKGSFCIENNTNNPDFLSKLELKTVPKHPSYVQGHVANPDADPNTNEVVTNDCFLYFSDGQNYSIRTKGKQAYLIQESRHPQTKAVQKKCETGWIPFGNRCVMKYEAKCQGDSDGIGCTVASNTAVSAAANRPWRNINQIDAKKACEKIGAHLMTNAEWMALARDIEGVKDNWSNNILARGWSANTSYGDTWTNNNTAPETGASCLYNTAANTCGSSGAHLYKRTHKLSNKQEIWDLSGNAWEWVDETMTTAEAKINFSNQSSNWYEYNGTTSAVSRTANFSNGTILPYSLAGSLGKEASDNSSKGLGRIYIDTNGSYSNRTPYNNNVHAFRRGGDWGHGAYSGVFTLYLNSAPECVRSSVGFRCVR